MLLDNEVGEADFAQHRVPLAGGRRLLVAEFGPRSASPIVYVHGFLGSRLEPRAGAPLDANILAPDRPGYGGSLDASPPSFDSFARALEEALSELGIDRFGLIGVSAGAPFAVAAALRMRRRVSRLVLVCAVADAALVASGGGSVRSLTRFRRHRTMLQLVLPRLIRQARHHGLDARFVRHVLRAERDRLGPDAYERAYRGLLVSLREGVRAGLGGLMGDIDLLTRPWEIDPASLEVPTLVLHGGEDGIVPPEHGRWYAARIPGATFELHPDQGHISLVINRADRIVRACLDGWSASAA